MADVAANWAGRGGRFAGGLYDFGVEREVLARPAGLLMWGTDTRLLFDSIRRIGDLPDGTAVLDIPCGGGLALRGLRHGRRLRYVAADISADMLARAQRRAATLGRTDVRFVVADIERMPFGDGEFDCCVTFNGLHCVPDPAAAVAEIARCVKPGGRLIGDAVVRGAGRRQDALIAVFRRAGVFGPGGTTDELQGWLTRAGFEVEDFRRSGAVAHCTAVRS
ncbi:class I SAM-dependent methyltransferase [Mycolicibacterium thermoresistibile]